MIRLGIKTKTTNRLPRMRGWPKQVLPFVVYLITTNTPNHYYVGQTSCLRIRMLQHLGKKIGVYKAAKFIKAHGFMYFTVLCQTDNQQEALRREEFYFHRLSFENPNWVVSMGAL